MAQVLFKRIEDSSHIDDVAIEDGSVIITGNGKMFIDYNGDRTPVGGTPDTEMSSTSTNSVENKVIKQYVDDKAKNEITTDSRGWTIIEHDSYTEYLKKGVYERTMNGGQWGRYQLEPLPTGMTDLGDNFLTVSAMVNDGAINCSIGAINSDNNLSIQLFNAFSSAINVACSYSLRILKIKE